jgi:hypothetical protein
VLERSHALSIGRGGAPAYSRTELRSRPADAPDVSVQGPNDLWTVDLKG